MVYVDEEGHYEFAVNAIGNTTVARNERIEILDVVGALDRGGEKAAIGRDERGEEGKGNGVQLHWNDVADDEAVGEREGLSLLKNIFELATHIGVRDKTAGMPLKGGRMRAH